MNLMRIKIIIFLWITVIPVFAQDVFTIDEAINFGIKNSPQTKLNQLDLLQAEGQIKEYKATGLPQINGRVNYQHFINLPVSLLPAEFFGGPPGTFAEIQFGLKNSLTTGVELTTLIFDGSFFTGLKAQRLYRELVYKEAEQTEYEIRKNVTKSYLGVLIAQRNKIIIEKNLDNLGTTLAETIQFYENGLVERLDVDRLQLSYDNLETEIIRIERMIVLSKNILKFQMNYPLEKDIELSESIDDLADLVFVEKVDFEKPIDYELRPELAVIRTTEQLNELNIEAIRKGYLPSLVGFANYQTSIQRNNLFDSDAPGFFPTTIAGVALSVPIWDSFSKNSQIQQAKIDLEKVKLQKNEFMRGVNLEVTNAKLNYQNAMATVNSTKRNEALANSIYNTSQIKFREGVGSSIELTQAEQNLYAAQANYINALYELVVAKMDLNIALGIK